MLEHFQRFTIKSYTGNDDMIHISVKAGAELEPEIVGLFQVFIEGGSAPFEFLQARKDSIPFRASRPIGRTATWS